MTYDNDLYPSISPEDEATYMSQFDSDYDDSLFDFDADWREEDYDDSLDWDDEDALTSAGMGMDESYGYAEDAFLDSFYEEQFECENDFGCDW